ncbi:alpha-ketoacid dehydrogenase subunit beta [Anaerotignum propionicum]|uniref:2-oxoisovalerate dehydrogenase subunit beta n=1 Tax=Anaerotignum propionicum DSM 1682 TaxID=991789 RepID=A0A0X1U6T2_ANAPI|nr:alpha-ketoacid dehydrogenase subunit beta [Anaerotignum propionicum]AMJ40641.1 2-oxoisovalerate dehydrogenase subunit beta [Anaerotignum propionicum DSM 1682]SHE91132.1 pyruvate dehydrogenase E1 component beta subunit [[Clostridium] propionicum DSM 1682] [Anaerotignum propionicum DSM 1682]
MHVTYGQAISDALREEMEKDENVVVFGEDVAQHGGIFGITRGLYEIFGEDRVKNTPISETSIIGVGAGAALVGLRPCIELMYSDFLLVAFSEIYHCVAKWRFMHGDQYKIPMVIRAAAGSAFGAGAEHSNCVESLFMHTPGLIIISPSTAADAKGLLKSAIRSDNPVLFFEHKQLYQVKEDIPDEEYTIPIGVADIKREGSDVTIVAIGLMVKKAMEAAEKLAAEGISAEVLDPRTIAPLDKETIRESIEKTHRAIVVEEGNKTGGIGAEIAAMMQEEMYDELDGPVLRVAALDVPLPYDVALELVCIPNADKIVETVKRLF